MIPVELQQLIAIGLAFLVTEGLKALSNLVGKDLNGAGAAIAAALTTAALVFFEAILGAVPEQYRAVVKSLLGLLVVLLSAFGVHKQVKRFESLRVNFEAEAE
jgi:hypothetical protein